ncbi:hypothetical protein WISP_105317 [Willisornis vidua]|uniref:Uncharacterized protein n=1 Tax=Willisornis vidua TaxID=1566151 RepID=A0ABQ9D237_9PASS|nr:hypothetical protein WISP_105317 [Willisornis vidua]
MRYNKTKSKVLQLGQGNSKYQYRLGDEQMESSPPEKDLSVLVDERLDMTWQCALTAQQAKHILDCIQSRVASRVREMVRPQHKKNVNMLEQAEVDVCSEERSSLSPGGGRGARSSYGQKGAQILS